MQVQRISSRSRGDTKYPWALLYTEYFRIAYEGHIWRLVMEFQTILVCSVHNARQYTEACSEHPEIARKGIYRSNTQVMSLRTTRTSAVTLFNPVLHNLYEYIPCRWAAASDDLRTPEN